MKKTFFINPKFLSMLTLALALNSCGDAGNMTLNEVKDKLSQSLSFQPKITMEQYRKVKTGMSYDDVVIALGGIQGQSTEAASALGVSVENYFWEVPQGFGTQTKVPARIEMTFINDNLVSKSQTNLQTK